MKFLYAFLIVLFFYLFFVARTETPEPPAKTTPPPNLVEVVVGLVEFVQSGKGLDYESSSMDGSVMEFTNVVTQKEPQFQFETIRINRPDIVTDQDLSTISLELVGASLVNEQRVNFGFNKLVLEMPIETVAKLRQIALADYDSRIPKNLRNLRLDTFLIKDAYFLDENCDFRIGLFEVGEAANLNIKFLNLERIGIACAGENPSQINVPYIYIDNLSSGIYPELFAYRFHSAIQNLKETSNDKDTNESLYDPLSFVPMGYYAQQIRISDITANIGGGLLVETDAVSMSTNVEDGGKKIVSSMTPFTATINAGPPPSELSESDRELFELFFAEALKLRFRQEQQFDIENDRFFLPLDKNFFEINDLVRLNFVLEVEGIASILEEAKYMLAQKNTIDVFDENTADLVRSNLKFRKLGLDLKDSGVIDFAFQLAGLHYGQHPALLKGAAGLVLASFPRNNDLDLSSNEEAKLAEITKVLSLALRKQGTMSVRFNLDNLIHDLQDEERRRKMIFENMTLEFVE